MSHSEGWAVGYRREPGWRHYWKEVNTDSRTSAGIWYA